jgi:GTP cyclohydrolase I
LVTDKEQKVQGCCEHHQDVVTGDAKMAYLHGRWSNQKNVTALKMLNFDF